MRASPGARPDAGTTAVLVLAAALVVWLGVLLALRTPFRCDLYVAPESAFMTDMMKLAHGQPVYTAPTDVNSFEYAPGLQYLTRAALAPFGRALDVRWCRVVSIVLGLAAAAVFAALVSGERRRGFALAFLVATLLVFASYTSDVAHPDNLTMLHAMLTLLLTVVALRRRSFAVAAASMAVAGLGVLVRQYAVLAAVGAGAALVLGGAWGAPRALALLAIGTGVTAAAALPLVATPEARYFALHVPFDHAIQPPGYFMLLADLGHGHRLLLALLLVPALVHLLRRGRRRLLLAWASVGVAAVLPALVPYLKVDGSANNLTIVMLWLLVPCWLALTDDAPDGGIAGGAAVRTAVLVVLVLTLAPTRLPPSPAAVAYCDRLIADVGTDLRAGRRVLLGHGTTPLLANGVDTPPLDRLLTMQELFWAGNPGDPLSATRARLTTRQYDRIYLDGTQYLPVELGPYYRAVDEIPAPVRTEVAKLIPVPGGVLHWTAYLPKVTVYEPTTTAGR